MRIWIPLLAAAFLLAASPLTAGESGTGDGEPQMVVALITDDFELPETDLSHLEIGDAETVYTESGRTIDLLRTEEGIEIYVDGERLDIPMHDGSHHEGRRIVHKHFEVECDSESDCEGLDVDALHGDGHHEKVIIIRKESESG